ncbi:MAG: flagellar export chaperone FliS [Alkalimonas sp.]|uniref:Flagellar secretion chaperone FliS n=1 Tax=Alkalimonas delamerensis TaxID=265981 RepID=A0ABT9GNU5_9GAMM|nr:flagellar export chaperone FliS [Alkalimonas delamerensis]MCC5853791.1 flagellar export chaperone FliS [Alkalimonas sp.]MDP4528326.1 flagellar export chaperone FliS [Alkalimonas delamerensis]
MSYGIKAYKSVGVKDDLAVADPHRVIQLLMQGALENMAKAKGCMERKDYAGKSATISKSMSIISALQGSLDMELGGEISENLWSLYDFMVNHLILASRENNAAKVADVMELMLSIKTAWDQIPVAEREKGYQMQAERQSQTASGF